MATTTEDLLEHARRMQMAYDTAQARFGKGAAVTFNPKTGVFKVVQYQAGERTPRILLLEAPSWHEFWTKLTGDTVGHVRPRARQKRARR